VIGCLDGDNHPSQETIPGPAAHSVAVRAASEPRLRLVALLASRWGAHSQGTASVLYSRQIPDGS
jgi:hypothetical protein